MRDSVRRNFVAFSTRFEGKVSCMYLDILGWVTTAIGVLIDPVQLAIGLPWRCADGTLASNAQIRAEWTKIHDKFSLRKAGWQAAQAIATLHLDEAGIEQAVSRKLAVMEWSLKGRFPDWEKWPADGQLLLLSMAWAMGPAFHFPLFEDAVRAGDWNLAATRCHMKDDQNPGLRPRNLVNKILATNAAKVSTDGLCPETLYYPQDLNS